MLHGRCQKGPQYSTGDRRNGSHTRFARSAASGTSTHDPGRKEGHLRFVARYGVRVVRLLPLRFAGGDHRQAVLQRLGCGRSLHLRAAGFCSRLSGAALRGDRVRPARRHDRAQVHLPGDHSDHGPVDLYRRPLAQLRDHRRRGAGDPDRIAHAAGPGARRRVRRCSHLRGRALAVRQARCLHLVDTDHGNARPVPEPAGHPGRAHLARRRGLRQLGLAHSVPGVDRVASHLGLDSPVAVGIAGVPENEGRGQDLQGAR